MPQGKEDTTILNSVFFGRPVAEKWSRIHIKAPRKKKNLFDVSYMYSGEFVIKSEVRNLLDDIVGNNAEWLEVTFYDHIYWILNSIHQLDIIDWKQSLKLPSVFERNFYCIYHFKSLVLKSQKRDIACFKIKGLMEIFYSQAFVYQITQANLSMGIHFRLLPK